MENMFPEDVFVAIAAKINLITTNKIKRRLVM